MSKHGLDSDDIELFLSHIPQSLMPEVLLYLAERMPEMIPQILTEIVRQMNPEQRKKFFEEISDVQENKEVRRLKG